MRTTFRYAISVTLLAFAASAAARAAGSEKDLSKTPQAKAYQTLLKAVAAGDFEGYKKSMTKASAEGIDQQIKESGLDAKKGMELLKAMSPSDMKFTSLKVDGKKATLEATGTVGGEANNRGTIELEQEDGQWKIAKQSWTNSPK